MGATEKLDAAFHPQAGTSGAAVVLRATDAADTAARHTAKLRAAVDDIRKFCEAGAPEGTVRLKRILTILDRHGV